MFILKEIDRCAGSKRTELDTAYSSIMNSVLVFDDVKRVVLSFLPDFTQFSFQAGFKNYLQTTCSCSFVGNFKRDLTKLEDCTIFNVPLSNSLNTKAYRFNHSV